MPAHILARLCGVLCVSPSYFFHPESGESGDDAPGASLPERTGRRERLARMEIALMRQDMLIARQLEALDDLDRDGCANLARSGRRALSALEETRAMFAEEIGRIRCACAVRASAAASLKASRSPAPPD